jgi:galactonate dehydratase
MNGSRKRRPYVFVKVETNQGVVGWGSHAREEGFAAMACVMDLKD